MGGKSSKNTNGDDSERGDISVENSAVFAESDAFSSEPDEHTEEHHSRRSSASNKELSVLFERHKDFFFGFDRINLIEKMSDEFQSNVYRGNFREGDSPETLEVLVKIPFNQRFTTAMAKKLVKNASRQVKLRHENIVPVLGFALSSEQIFLITEYCSGGTLLTALKQNSDIPLRRLYEWAIDIAKGMEFLANNQIMHRNLCAAICLMSESNLSKAKVKVSDFIHPTELGLSEFSVFPLRWIAPETIETAGGNTSYSGDVWSFGILLWELFSGGKEPYPNISSNIVLQEHLINRGGIHEKPEKMPQSFYSKIMVPCLHHSTGKRPSFTQLLASLQDELSSLPKKQPELPDF